MADINAQDGRGRTPLHHAVINRQPATVQQLLAQGANPEIKDNQGRKGFTPMWYACCQNADPLSVRVLKSANAKVDQTMIDEMKRQAKADPLNADKKAVRSILGVSA